MFEVALFGAGRMGQIHAGNLARHSGVALKYVVDVNGPAAAELAAKYGARVADMTTVFDDRTVAAVVIASSTDTHADLILRAAAAGKAIFCEKPVDLSLDRARACADAVARANVPSMIGFQRRFDPTFAALKVRLAAGEIGDPEMLVITSRDPRPPPLGYIKSSGGIFKDMMVHDFDIFRWILEDEGARLYATGSCLVDPEIGEAGDADSAAVTVRSRRGLICQINITRRASYGYDQRFEVLGSRGMLQARNHRPTEVMAHTAVGVSEDKPEPFFLERYRVAYALEIAHFFEAIASGGAPRTSIADGVKALELSEAATRSWREGRAVEL